MQKSENSDLEQLKESMLLPNPFEAGKSAQESQQWEMIKSPLNKADQTQDLPFKDLADKDDQDRYENLLMDKIRSNSMVQSRYELSMMNKTQLNQPQEVNTPGSGDENSSNVNSEPTIHPREAPSVSDDSFHRMNDQ